MSAQLFNMVAKRALKDAAKKNINSKDPYFEEVAIYGRDGRPTGRVKKQKKGIPAILSRNDGKVLKRVRRQAYRLDMSLFNCCGIRFGWGSVIGFIPVVGDVIDLLLAYSVVTSCAKIDGGLPPALQARMYFNIMLDFGIGLVPFVGDVADAMFRANTRNAWVLEEYLIKKAETEQRLRQEKAQRDNQNNQQQRLGDGRPLPNPGPAAGDGAGADPERPAPKKSFWSSWGRSAPQDVQTDQEMAVVEGAQGRQPSDLAYDGRA
ncbi:PH domain protein [Sporothrix brasiliensis 5110]|uniref:PH domain protein n=1 Tax=Sporothrix brasiliensis 5110 TaxID=1398154 RepID=A0A0C2IX67_9PEZI|nr:PH domain protein [Sporothrix brasiliensis 5110]KIH93701.1 PH domain protein [Sporothrix brasiliensis 5110]